MNQQPKKQTFVQKHLDPASRLGEILFGLIMVLTSTLTAGLTISEGKAGVRQLLLAALGCNLAWGIIDGIMYIMNCMTERSARLRTVQEVHKAPTAEVALSIIRQNVEPEFEELTGKANSETVSRFILNNLEPAPHRILQIQKEDLLGAIACCWLVFLSCFPVTIPFIILSDPHLALRVSNCLLIIMLFIVGQKWAHYVGMNRLWAGVVMVIIGLALVEVAIIFGG